MAAEPRSRLPDLSQVDEDEPPAEATVMLDVSPQAPSTRQVPCFVVTSGAATLGMLFLLRGEVLLGRSAGCGILLAEEDVSRKHARLTVRPDGAVDVVDLGSSNGIYHGERRVASATVHPGERIRIGRATLTLVTMDDADEVVERNRLVASTRDPVSGLRSRRYFIDTLRSELAPEAGRASLSLLCFSVDDFATIVDMSGRVAADDLVRRLGIVALEVVRAEDTVVGQIADGEVALLLPGRTATEAATTAEWIRAAFASALRGNAAPASPGLSVGLGHSSDAEVSSADELLAVAVRALRFAQASGGDRTCSWASLRKGAPRAPIASGRRDP